MSLSYTPHHPWYYLLGGTILYPKQIGNNDKETGYKGYRRDEILTADNHAEPQRSEALKSMKSEVLLSLRNNIKRYRQLAFQLRVYRTNHHEADLKCQHIHTNVSLKYNHLFNDFAHLNLINELLEKQGDLFD